MLKVLKYLKPFKTSAILAVVFIVANNATSLVLPLLMAKIINEGITEGNIFYILKIGGIMLSVSAVGIFTSIIGSYFSSRASTGFGMELRSAIFTKVENLSQADLDNLGVSSLITRSTNDVKHIQDMVMNGLRMIISSPILLIGGAILAVFMNPQLSTVILIAIPIIAFVVYIVAKRVIPRFDEIQKRTDRLNQVVREKITGIRVIRAFNREDYEDDRFTKASKRLTELSLKVNRTFAFLIPVAVTLLFGMIILLVWLSSVQVNRFDAVLQAEEIANTVGDLQAFIIYLFTILIALVLAASMFIMFPYAKISAKRICEVLDIEPSIKEDENPIEPDENRNGELVFDNVSFGYPGADKPILSNISFSISKGETVAIIGGTGCGKSTLINLIPRFYDVTEGSIKIDGVDIKKMSFESINKRIGFVPQKAVLFSGTVADNLRFGKRDATITEIEKALSTSQAKEFVDTLPNKLYEMVSQGGNTLSGGQKQRLAIARALIKNAEFFIFDDSFSALDLQTDAKLRAALKKDLADATVIIIAQRIGTIMDVDKIVVLEEGKVVCVGNHKELLQSCPIYREIADSQFSISENGGDEV